jgi:hypothetical protein
MGKKDDRIITMLVGHENTQNLNTDQQSNIIGLLCLNHDRALSQV